MDPNKEIHGTSHDGKDDDSHRSHDVNRIISDSIPPDLTLEIFSRLPAKSIVRSLCVSKLWSSFTKHPSFINFFATRSSARPSLLLTFHKDNKRFVFSFPQHQNLDRSYPPVESYQMENPKDWTFTQLESVHGLIFLRDHKIWNPTMRQFFSLPKPKSSSMIGLYLLAYEPLECKHKLLCIFYHNPQYPLVFTIGAARVSWRNTEGCPKHYPTFSTKCINGILYYKAFFCVARSHAIMSFDARSEKFNMIKFPEDYISCSIMVPYEGRLALVPTYNIPSDGNVDLWILRDAARQEWTRTRFLLPLYEINPVWKADLKLRGITEAGELIYVPRTLSETVYILYVDLRRNIIREALFEGIFGDEFRCRYGLGNYHSIYSQIYNMDVFPNHIETFVSL